ncbi:MAG TPA: acyl-CoA dehydrogenase family protein [Streptosporangiaceae bacterium]|nr:acyl-CoA dehydrogenase family protein [Streptosporangiaceae bacterium]
MPGTAEQDGDAKPADYGLTAELAALRDTVRAFLAEACPPAARRDAAPGDPALWRRLAGELGLVGLAVPEEYGGAGGGMIELAVVCEELGRALTPVPYLATAVLAAHAARGDPRLAERLLPGIAAGSATATVILDGSVTVRAGRLWGAGSYVLDGTHADVVLVPVRDGHVDRLYAVPGDASGLGRRARPTLDRTRPLASLVFEGVAAEPYRPARGVETRDLAITALAAEQVGGAERCLEMATDYAKARVQFGRPIGSFQAIKHKLADLLVSVESARSAARGAAWAADREPDRLPVAAAMAGSYCGEAFLRAAGENIQIHGGIGVTWEHDAHLYLRRATSSAQLFGTPAAHRARLAPVLGL